MVKRKRRMSWVPTHEEVIDKAFRRAKRVAMGIWTSTRGSHIYRTKKTEEQRVLTAWQVMNDKLKAITENKIDFDELHPFYRDLITAKIDIGRATTCYRRIEWAVSKILEIRKETIRKIRRSRMKEEIIRARREFYGRSSSILRDISDCFQLLRDLRQILEDLPTIDPEREVVIVAGYPNVGKSTLLRKLTKSNPKVSPYPFTTKKIQVGVTEDGVQVIDSPGLLYREKKNWIEKQAVAALRHLKGVIVYVFDPTETCGYSLEDQRKLLEEVERIGKPVIKVANKSDIPWSKEVVIEGALPISAERGDNLEELLRLIKEKLEVTK